MFSSSKPPVLYLSMSDASHPLSAVSHFSFHLDDMQWPSVTHYFQASKFNDAEIKKLIAQAKLPNEAEKIAKKNKRKIRPDWAAVELVLMTRAVYVKCRTHQSVSKALLKTGEIKIVENSQYDYYWGCGRDARGKNHYGRILMNVRDKLREI